jgi:hypothetical protein
MILTESFSYLSNGWASVEDFDNDGTSFVLTGVEEVPRAVPNLTDELEVFAWNYLPLYSHTRLAPSVHYAP